MSKKAVSIIAQVRRIITDRTQYKNYQPEVEFKDLFVEFLIPADKIVAHEGGYILTFEAFANHILDPFNIEIEKMHDTWKLKRAEAEEAQTRAAMRRHTKETRQ